MGVRKRYLFKDYLWCWKYFLSLFTSGSECWFLKCSNRPILSSWGLRPVLRLLTSLWGKHRARPWCQFMLFIYDCNLKARQGSALRMWMWIDLTLYSELQVGRAYRRLRCAARWCQSYLQAYPTFVAAHWWQELEGLIGLYIAWPFRICRNVVDGPIVMIIWFNTSLVDSILRNYTNEHFL